MAKRFSKQREKIFSLLKKSKKALSASQIHEKLPDINLVTIYRNLDVLTKEGVIKKLSLKDTESLYEYQRTPHHHAVCRECHKVIHFHAPDQKLKKLLGVEDFEIDELEVTVRGVCAHDRSGR